MLTKEQLEKYKLLGKKIHGEDYQDVIESHLELYDQLEQAAAEFKSLNEVHAAGKLDYQDKIASLEARLEEAETSYTYYKGEAYKLKRESRKDKAELAELKEKVAWYFECAKMYDWFGWSEEVESYKQWDWIESNPHSILGRKAPYYNADNEIAESLERAEKNLKLNEAQKPDYGIAMVSGNMGIKS